MAANERVSSLVIKARDEYSRALANLEKRQGSLAAAQKRASDISAAKKALQEHRDAYLDLERQLKNTSAVLTELHAKKQRNTEDFSNYSLAAVNLAAPESAAQRHSVLSGGIGSRQSAASKRLQGILPADRGHTPAGGSCESRDRR